MNGTYCSEEDCLPDGQGLAQTELVDEIDWVRIAHPLLIHRAPDTGLSDFLIDLYYKNYENSSSTQMP